MPELRQVVFRAVHQLSKDLDNSSLLKSTVCVFLIHHLPEKVLHQRGITLRSVREPHIEGRNRKPLIKTWSVIQQKLPVFSTMEKKSQESKRWSIRRDQKGLKGSEERKGAGN